MADQRVVFDFAGQGAGQLADDFRKVGDNAAIAGRGARLCADALDKQRKAAGVSAGATLALAKADDILKEAEHGLAEGALEAEFALKKQAEAAKKAGLDAAAASAGLSGLAGSGGIPGGGIGAVIAAGVALAPVLVTVGAGTAGFAAAAYGAIAPIEKAAQKTGGLQKHMALLNPEQQQLARSILGLGQQYHQFGQQLQPEVLGVFNTGLRLAGHLMRDVQPVAQATGKAFDVLLGRIDAEFASGTWQQFFGFMARTAGPDVALLGNLFIQLAADLPPLLEQLQPLAEGFLKDADAILKLVGAITTAVAWEHQHAQAVSDNTGLLGRFGHAALQAFEQLFPGVKAAKALQDQLDKAGASTDATGKKLQGLGGTAAAAAVKVQTLQQAVAALTSTEDKALSPLLAYSNALIAQRNDADSLSRALKTSHDRIGLNTAEQRASFGAANTYIQDLLTTASAAVKSHQGIDAQIRSIQSALPQLQQVRGGTRLYWQEVSTLVAWLNRLKQIKLISEAIHVSGTGVWTVTPGKIGLPGGSAGGPFAAGGVVTGGTPGRDSVLIRAMPGEVVIPASMVRAGAVDHLRGALPGFAAGGVVGSWPRLPGLGPWAGRELRATESAIGRSVASALVAGIKAASAAGSVGSYKPGAGVAQWRGVVRQALSLAGANVAQLTDPVLYQMSTESGGNPYAINKWDSNWLAGHPSVGLMQVIRGTFAAYAGRFRGTGPFAYGVSENPLANTYSAIRYAQANYGPGLRNAYGGIGSGHGYDSGGWLMPGLTLAWNGTGRPEQVIPGGRGAASRVILEVTGSGHGTFDAFLLKWLRENVRVKGGGSVQHAFGMAGRR